MASWNILLKDIASKKIEDAEPVYEDLLKTYPTCGRFWKTYIEHEMREKNYDKVSKLFQRSLGEVLSIDLYKCYLNYIQETKANEPDLILDAFKFTLGRVGIDPHALSIFNDYIQFLREREVDGAYLDSQRIQAVRRAYQEGVVIPMFHVDTLWKDYSNFEQSLNAIIAEKMIQDYSRNHMNARRVSKEWEVTIRGLNRSWPPVPPTFSPEELKQLEIWRRYITWERSNPLRTENHQTITKRVIYAYKQFLLCFCHHPNIWHEFACYLEDRIKSLSELESKGDFGKLLRAEIATLFERSIKGSMKHNLLMHFAYADYLENKNDKKKANEIYSNLAEAGREEEKIDLNLVYIQWIRFTRRTEGIKAARLIFKKARDESRCSHQIYSSAALMEYNCTKDQSVACKIFELGMKKYSGHVDFILSYIHFMNSLNEENNTRVLFERVLTTCSLQPKDTVEIWNSFLEFEAGIGDLSSTEKVERRRASALEKLFPKSSETSWSIDKYKFQNLYPCSLNELKSLGYEFIQATTSLPSVRELVSSLQDSSSAQQSASSTSQTSKKIKNSAISNKTLNDQMTELFDQAECDQEFPLESLNNQTDMCLPDLDQMLPFKPMINPTFGAHTVPGGVFPPPPAIGNILSKLPQPGSFWGPFVDIEELCNIIRISDFDRLFNNLREQRRGEMNKRRKPEYNESARSKVQRIG